jgi:hypothetical protein
LGEEAAASGFGDELRCGNGTRWPMPLLNQLYLRAFIVRAPLA